MIDENWICKVTNTKNSEQVHTQEGHDQLGSGRARWYIMRINRYVFEWFMSARRHFSLLSRSGRSPSHVIAPCARHIELYSRSVLLLSLKMKNLREGCVSLLALFSVCFAQRSPSITYISEDQVVDVGGTVELSCSVQYGTEFSVNWLKQRSKSNEHIFLSTGTSLVVKESRFALLYDGASATYIVLIKDVQETDTGTYQCEVVLSVNNKISAETHLSVRRPPVITDNSTQAIVTTAGEPVLMECYATGFPVPKIVWRRENNAILPTGKCGQRFRLRGQSAPSSEFCASFVCSIGEASFIWIYARWNNYGLTSVAFSRSRKPACANATRSKFRNVRPRIVASFRPPIRLELEFQFRSYLNNCSNTDWIGTSCSPSNLFDLPLKKYLFRCSSTKLEINLAFEEKGN